METVAVDATTEELVPVRHNLFRRVLKNRAAAIAAVYLVLLVGMALLAPVLAPFDPAKQDIEKMFATPSAEHLLGTDDLGRDILSRLIWATRVSLGVSVAVILATVALATPIGLYAGFRGGRVDSVIMRFVDAGLSVPPLVLALAVAGVLGPGAPNVVLALVVVFVPGLIRLVRAETLALAQETFVEASRIAGTRPIRIMLSRLLPNVRSSLIVQGTILIGQAMLAEASLSYLGLGVQSPDASWGNMLRRAYERALFTEPWQLIVPVVAIGLTVLAIFVVGDGLRDAQGGSRSQHPSRKDRRGITTVDRSDAGTVIVPMEVVADRAAPLLRIDGLTVEFAVGAARHRVVDDLGLSVAPKEIVGLVGESGSGKTVTALAAMRLLSSPPAEITAGQVVFDGRDVLDLSFRELRELRGAEIAMVFQDPMSSVDPAFTVGDQLVEAQRLHGARKRRAAQLRALELLELVGIADPNRVMRSYPHQLSGGMVQRVVIAMALSCDPKLLIADEPTTGLDVTIQAQVLDLLKSLRDELDLAILLVTHDFGVVADICDRVAVMYAGQLVEEGSVDELFEAPRHPYTRALLQSMPQVTQESELLRVIPGRVPPVGMTPFGCRFHPRCALALDSCASTDVELALRHDRLVRCLRADEFVPALDEETL